MEKGTKYAFWLAVGCLIGLAGVGVTDVVLGRDMVAQSKALSGLVDLLKTLAALALGYFFAGVTRHKDEEE